MTESEARRIHGQAEEAREQGLAEAKKIIESDERLSLRKQRWEKLAERLQ